MGLRLFISLGFAALFLTAAAPDVRKASVDPDWRACVAQPTRACVAARALALTRTIPTPPEQAKAIDQLLGAASDLKMLETVALAREAEAQLATVDWEAGREDIRLSIAKAYAKAGDFAAAKAMLPRFTNPAMERQAVIEIAVALGRARSVAEAVALLRTERSTKSVWRSWSHAAWHLRGVAVMRGEEAALLPTLQEAQAARNTERSKEPGLFVAGHESQYIEPLLIIAAELTAQGRAREALTLGRGVSDAPARLNIVGGIAAVLARAGRTDEALEIALASPADDQGQELKVAHRVLSVVFMPQIADLHGDLLGGPFPKIARPAADVFAASMRLAAHVKEGDERDTAYAVVAIANAREDAIANAQRAAAEIKGLFYLRTALTEIGEAQARAGARAASIATFARVRALILTEPSDPDGWEWREGSLSDLAQRQARAGQIDEALAIVRAMKGNEMTTIAILQDGRQVSMDYNRRDALYEIARAMAKAGRVDEAFAIARSTEHPDVGYVGNGLGVVAEGLVAAGRIDDALRALDALSESGRRDTTLVHILRGRLAAGVTADAERFVAAIADDADRAVALGEVAAAVLKAGDAARAVALVKQALALADGLPYAYQAVDALAQAMRGLAA